MKYKFQIAFKIYRTIYTSILPLAGYSSSITFAPQSMQVFSYLSHNSVNAIATRVHCWLRFEGDQNAPNAALHPSLCLPPLATPFGCTTAVLGW